MALAKFQMLLQDFVLPPKREYPRFQVVNLSELNESNLDSFLDQLITILDVQHQITSSVTAADKRSRLLSLQGDLINRGDGPGFRLAMSKDDSVLGAQPVDVKKLKRVVAAAAQKLQIADIRQILTSLLETYGSLEKDTSTLPNLQELRKFREELLLTFNQAAQVHNPVMNPVSSASSTLVSNVTTDGHYTEPEGDGIIPTPLPISSIAQQSPVSSAPMNLAELSPNFLQRYENSPETHTSIASLSKPKDSHNSRAGPTWSFPPNSGAKETSWFVDTEQAQTSGMQWRDQIPKIPDQIRRMGYKHEASQSFQNFQQPQPRQSDMPIFSQSKFSVSSPQPVWASHVQDPSRRLPTSQFEEWLTSNMPPRVSQPQMFQQQQPCFQGPPIFPESSIARQMQFSSFQPTSMGPYQPCFSQAPPQGMQFSTFQPNSMGPNQPPFSQAAPQGMPFPPFQPNSMGSYQHQANQNNFHPTFSGFSTLHTAPPPPLPIFHGNPQLDTMSVLDFKKKFLAMAPMYGTEGHAVWYLEANLKDTALSWFKCYVSRYPNSDIHSILNALSQQFSSQTTWIEKMKRMAARLQKPGEPLQNYFAEKLRLISQWNPSLNDPETCEFLWDGMQPSLCRDTRAVQRYSLDAFMRECLAIEAENKRFVSREKSTTFSDAVPINLIENQSDPIELLRDMLINHIDTKASTSSNYKKSPYPSKKLFRSPNRSASRQNSASGSKNSSHQGSRSHSPARSSSSSTHHSRSTSKDRRRFHSKDRSHSKEHRSTSKDRSSLERASSSGNYKKPEQNKVCSCSCQKTSSKNGQSQR